MDRSCDVIVVGAGMGGLTAGAFLAAEGKKVLVLEKHDKPGGYVTSFTRHGYRFDSGLFHVNEAGPDGTIQQFMRYWGEELPVERVQYKLRWFVGEREYLLDTRDIEGSLCASFPGEEAAIRRFFGLIHSMFQESRRLGPPKPPYEMNLLEKAVFGLKSRVLMPTFLRYAFRPGTSVLQELFPDRALATLIYGYYPMDSLTFLAHAWGWDAVKQGGNYYPAGGMQAIPDATARAIEKHGGRVLTRADIRRIVVEGGKATGVECVDGRAFRAETVIANAPLHHTLNTLLAGVPGLERLRARVARREVFPSAVLLFLGVDQGYDFRGANYFVLLDEDALALRERDLTPANCPVALVVPPQPEGQAGRSALAVAFLPYAYGDCWATGGTKARGEAYRTVKEQVKDAILDRLFRRLGEDFRAAVRYSLAATPLTLERYTHNERGAIMGWRTDARHAGDFLPHATPVRNLFLTGQWVFPGGGVPGVMAGGYFLAKELLEREGIDLEAKLTTAVK